MNIKAPRQWNVVFQLKDPVKRVLVWFTFSALQNQSSLKRLEWSITFFFCHWSERVAVAYYDFIFVRLDFSWPLFSRKVVRSSVNAINLYTQLSIAQKQINGWDLALGKLFFYGCDILMHGQWFCPALNLKNFEQYFREGRRRRDKDKLHTDLLFTWLIESFCAFLLMRNGLFYNAF